MLDGGRQLQARRDANGAAAAAARAAVQLSGREAYARRLDPGLATARAAAELGRQRATGSVSISGQSVTVTVRAAVDFLILPGGRTVSESATATPEQGVLGRSGAMTNARRVAGAVGAIALLVAFVVGVPFVLVRFVGNPWPGRTRIELRDEVGVLVGVLAVVAWLVWARFVLAVVVELRDQVAALRVEARRDPAARVEVVAPAPARGGIGILAQRLVAAALIILPIATRSRPGDRRRSRRAAGARPTAALVVDREPAPRGAAAADPSEPARSPQRTGGSSSRPATP